MFFIGSVPFHFGEQGNYSLWVKNLNDSSVVSCSVVTDTEPINSYMRESKGKFISQILPHEHFYMLHYMLSVVLMVLNIFLFHPR